MIENKGSANFTVGDITAATPMALPAGAKSRGAEAGIRHIF